MRGIGHNSNRDPKGYGARLVAWRKARAGLVNRALPIEVIRKRVARAAELGLDYRAYASIRAATGRDVLALLFSSNALRLLKEAHLPPDRAAKLKPLQAMRLVLAQGRLSPEMLTTLPEIDAARLAPAFTMSWSAMSEHLRADLKAFGQRGDATVIIGDTSFEAEWCTAAKAAGYLPAERYFSA